MRVTLYIVVLMSLALFGCATTYVPQGEVGGIEHGGYADTRVSGHTAVIKFQGNSYNTSGGLQAFLLRRSAEVTMENGYRYFTILSTTVSPINLNVHTQAVNYPIYPPSSSGSSYYTVDVAGPVSSSETETPYCQQRACGSKSVVAVIDMFNNVSGSAMPRTYKVDDVIGHQ